MYLHFFMLPIPAISPDHFDRSHYPISHFICAGKKPRISIKMLQRAKQSGGGDIKLFLNCSSGHLRAILAS